MSESKSGLMQQYLEDTRIYSSSSSTQYSPLPTRKTETQSFHAEVKTEMPNAEPAKLNHDLWRSETHSVRPKTTSEQTARLNLPVHFPQSNINTINVGQELKYDELKCGLFKEEKGNEERLGLLSEEDNATKGRLGIQTQDEETEWKELQSYKDNERSYEPVRLGRTLDTDFLDEEHRYKLPKPSEQNVPSDMKNMPSFGFDIPVSVMLTRPSPNIFPTDIAQSRPSNTFLPDYLRLPRSCYSRVPSYNTAPIYTTASFGFNPVHPKYSKQPEVSTTIPRPRPTYNAIPVSTSVFNTENLFSNQQYNTSTAQSNQDQSNLLLQFAQLQHVNMKEIVDLLTTNQKKASLPVKEPEVFSGDLISYPMWKASFTALIEQKTNDPSEKLYYLSKYTSGEAKVAIQTLISIGTQDAYDKAQQILTDRYGSKFLVANAFRNKLEKWPKIALNDGAGLRKFYDFLEQCKSAMASIRYMTYLNDPKENTLMLQKLPSQIAERWNTITTK